MKRLGLLLLLILLMSVSGCRNIPAITPQPTLQPTPPPVGTPSDWSGGISVYGTMPFAPSAGGVTIAVDAVEALPPTAGIYPLPPGYVFLVLSVRVLNDSPFSVSYPAFVVVDKSANQYAWWSTSTLGREATPLGVEPGEVRSDLLVYFVPESALQADLRLRWESGVHQARVEVLLPTDIRVRQP